MYGPVGGVVILLLFFYLDAVVLLIGAEINSEIDFVAYNVAPGSRDFRASSVAAGQPSHGRAKSRDMNATVQVQRVLLANPL